MNKFDMHIHGAPWTYGWTNYRRSVWYGWKAGCRHIGIAEHAPRMNHRFPFRSLYFSDFDRYFNVIDEIRLEFKEQVEILAGLEIDYHPEMVEPYREFLEKLPLDFTIGAVHAIGGWLVGVPGALEASEFVSLDAVGLYELYFRQIRDAAATRLFDFIAHPDYVRKEINRRGWAKPEYLTPLYRQTAEALSAYNTGIEINTRGAMLPDVGGFYPEFEFLCECAKAEVPLTIGSDSHDGIRVGESFAEAVDYARKAGYRELYIWRKRGGIKMI